MYSDINSSNREYSDYTDIYLSFNFLSNSIAIQLTHTKTPKPKQWSHELKACDLFMSLKLSRELEQRGEKVQASVSQKARDTGTSNPILR